MSGHFPDSPDDPWSLPGTSESKRPRDSDPAAPPDPSAPPAYPAWQQPPQAPQPWPGQPYVGEPAAPASPPLPQPQYPGAPSGPLPGMGRSSLPPAQVPPTAGYPPLGGYAPDAAVTYPGVPPGAYPQQPPFPQAPGTSGGPVMPGAPGMQGMPSMPPGYMGAPSMPPALGQPPAPLGYPTYPTYPSYPSQTLPGGLAPIPYAPYAPYGEPVEPVDNSLAQPFSNATAVMLFAGSIAVCLAAAIVTMAGFHADWSAGATAAGITALILATISGVVALIRIGVGRRARAMYILSAAMVLVLAITGLGSIGFASPLHGIQARSLERSGQWQSAISEYSASGQGAPNGPDVARVYDEWGEQLLGQRSYGLAVSRFDTVVSQYNQSGDAYTRARTDLYNAYKQWVGTNGTDVPYANAITFFETYATASGCDTACQSDAYAVDAQARFQYGTQLAASSNFADAITQFEAIQAKFSKSTYAPQAHAAAATAYYAEGKQALTTADCAKTALPAYQTLTSKYGDTPEGKKAKDALGAGVDVTGSISNLPKDSSLRVLLSKFIDANSITFSSDYTISPGTNGSFAFHGVKPGNYNVATSVYTARGVYFVFWHDSSGNPYFVHVGQLCPVQVTGLDPWTPPPS
jgi:tetratricopeptide (TPR) repeat protein